MSHAGLHTQSLKKTVLAATLGLIMSTQATADGINIIIPSNNLQPIGGGLTLNGNSTANNATNIGTGSINTIGNNTTGGVLTIDGNNSTNTGNLNNGSLNTIGNNTGGGLTLGGNNSNNSGTISTGNVNTIGDTTIGTLNAGNTKVTKLSIGDNLNTTGTLQSSANGLTLSTNDHNSIQFANNAVTIKGGTGTTTQTLDDNGVKLITTDPANGNAVTATTTISKDGLLTVNSIKTGITDITTLAASENATFAKNVNVTGKTMTGSLSAGTTDITNLAVSGTTTTTGMTNTGKLTNNGDLAVKSGKSQVTATANNVTVGVTNANGSINGVTATETQTVVKGGAGTTTLTLNDSGATFSTTSSSPAKVTGVANGVNDYDAANYGQLKSLRSEVMAKIDDANKEFSGGIASVIAISNIPQLDNNKTFGLGVGAGRYNGSNAFAVGMRYRVNESAVVTGSFGKSSDSKSALGVGAGFSW